MDIDEVLVPHPGLAPHGLDQLAPAEGHLRTTGQRGDQVELGAIDVKPQPGKASWQIACTSAEGSLAGPAEADQAFAAMQSRLHLGAD